MARGRSPPEGPGGGGLDGRDCAGGGAVDRFPFRVDGLGTGVSGSSSENWDILAAAAEYG